MSLTRGTLYNEEKNQYIYKGKQQSSFSAFSKWTQEGVWDEDFFVQELQEKYAQAQFAPSERFLMCYFWGLEQNDIDKGMPVALEMAYNGELSRGNLISLLTNIHALKEHSIKLPCEVSYDKMEAGFKLRIKGIKRGDISEPQCFVFAKADQLDEDALPLYASIRQLDDQMTAWKSRRMFIEYIENESVLSGYFHKGLCIDEFDDGLLELFIKKYSSVNNETKRDFALTFLDMVFVSSSYSTIENMQVTKVNFTKLSEWLDSQNAIDSITTEINRSFSEQLKEKISEMERTDARKAQHGG